MSKNVLIDEHASLILDCEVTISSPGTHKRARKRLYFNYFKELFIHFNGTLMIPKRGFRGISLEKIRDDSYISDREVSNEVESQTLNELLDD